MTRRVIPLFCVAVALMTGCMDLGNSNSFNGSLDDLLVPAAGIYPRQACSDDGLEPNDSIRGARELVTGSWKDLTICGNDDWYFVWVEDGRKLDVGIEFDNRVR